MFWRAQEKVAQNLSGNQFRTHSKVSPVSNIFVLTSCCVAFTRCNTSVSRSLKISAEHMSFANKRNILDLRIGSQIRMLKKKFTFQYGCVHSAVHCWTNLLDFSCGG